MKKMQEIMEDRDGDEGKGKMGSKLYVVKVRGNRTGKEMKDRES